MNFGFQLNELHLLHEQKTLVKHGKSYVMVYRNKIPMILHFVMPCISTAINLLLGQHLAICIFQMTEAIIGIALHKI